MESTIIILCFLLSCNVVYCFMNKDMFDYYLDKESYNEKHNIVTFAVCLKLNDNESDESSAKNCMASKIETFEGDIPVKSCPFLLEATKPNAVLGSHLRILPVNKKRAVIMALEKNWINETALEVFLKLTEIQYEDCEMISNLLIPMSLEEADIVDDYFLNDIHLLIDSENFLAIDNRHRFPSQISKFIFDYKGKYNIEPWFELHNRTLKEILLVKQETDDTIYLLIDNFLSAYLVRAKESEIKKLDFDHDEYSKLIYSTSHNYINLCYETSSTFNCAVFKDNGELESKWKFDVEWKVKNGFVHYNPDFGLALITDTYSESCLKTELKQFFTYIRHDQIESKEFDCVSRDYKIIGTFLRRKKSEQECFFRIKLDVVGTQLEVDTNNLCFMDFIAKMAEEFVKYMNKDDAPTEKKSDPELSHDEL